MLQCVFTVGNVDPATHISLITAAAQMHHSLEHQRDPHILSIISHHYTLNGFFFDILKTEFFKT